MKNDDLVKFIRFILREFRIQKCSNTEIINEIQRGKKIIKKIETCRNMIIIENWYL